ncbi:hypothetical protein [Pedobacter sp. MW01-1-1]|uniref:hypothetical protein n=1 Tax=Pedobacter sp. MW01-1-1 TaxID=3383027 RepID=UPI003FF064AC
MKTLLLTLSIMATVSVYAQKKESYTASNGITYKIGDTVKLGVGSGLNNRFLYMLPAPFTVEPSQNYYLKYLNTFVVIKKIKMEGIRDRQKMTFVVSMGTDARWWLKIDEAIQNCEVVPCKKTP